MLVGLLLIVAVVYWPALSGPFLLDDFVNIPQTHITNLSWQQLWHVAMSNESGRFGRPIPVLTFALNYYFGGVGTFSFKLINLILHMVNGCLLYVLLVKVLEAIKLIRVEYMPFDSRLFAIVIAGIWLVHPLQVSGVMYVVQRMNMLSTLFIFLALWVFSNYRLQQLSQSHSNPVKFLPIALGLMLILLACLSKENGVLAILYMGLLEVVIFRFKTRIRHVSRLYLHWIMVLGVLATVFSCLYFYFNSASLLHGYAIRDFSLAERLMTQASVLLFYIRQIILPDASMMGLYLDDVVVTRSLDLRAVTSIAGIGLLIAIGVLLRNRHPLICLGLGMFLLSHVLESTFLPLEMVFEHRNYFGLWGIVLVVVYGVGVFLLRIQSHYTYMLVGLCVAILGMQTFNRSAIWGDAFLHSAFSAESRPLSLRAQTNFATELARMGQLDAAENIILKVQERGIDPAYAALRLILLKGMRNQVEVEDIDQAITALSQQPLMVRHGTTLADIHTNYKNGRFDRPDLHDMLALYQVMADHADALLKNRDRARLQGLYAELLLKYGKNMEALIRINQAFSYDPTDSEIILRKAEVEHAAGARAELIDTLTQVKIGGYALTSGQKIRLQAIIRQSSVADAEALEDVVY